MAFPNSVSKLPHLCDEEFSNFWRQPALEVEARQSPSGDSDALLTEWPRPEITTIGKPRVPALELARVAVIATALSILDSFHR